MAEPDPYELLDALDVLSLGGDQTHLASDSVLDLRGVSKRLGGRTVLDNLNLRVHAGEVYCLLGANGAGKTTTINLVLGFLQPDGGDLRVGGFNPTTRPQLARQVTAYIPEQVALYPALTGLENLRYFAGLAGPPMSDDFLLDCLWRADLPADTCHRRLASYSKGMRQKVGIAIALAKNARLLLLDEPLSGLDPIASNEFVRLVRTQAAAGTAALIVTHDLFRAKQLATRIGILRQGRLRHELRASEIDAVQLEALYLELMEAVE